MLYPQTPRRLKISLNQNISSFMVTITRWKRQQLVQQNKVNGIGPRSRKRFRCTSPLASPHFLRSYLATFVKKTKMYLSGLPSIPRSAICARPKRGTSTVHRTLSTSFSCKEVTHLKPLLYTLFQGYSWLRWHLRCISSCYFWSICTWQTSQHGSMLRKIFFVFFSNMNVSFFKFEVVMNPPSLKFSSD